MSCSRSRHLILWLLGTLTGQQRFYGMRLVTRKGRHYHPLSVLPEANCIAVFQWGTYISPGVRYYECIICYNVLILNVI